MMDADKSCRRLKKAEANDQKQALFRMTHTELGGADRALRQCPPRNIRFLSG